MEQFRIICDETNNTPADVAASKLNGRIVVANEKKPDLIKAIENDGITKQDGSYDFLLSMPIWSLTYEKYTELQKKLNEVMKEQDTVSKTSPEDFYRQELKDLRKQVQKAYGS